MALRLPLKVFTVLLSLAFPFGPAHLATKASAETPSLSSLFHKGKTEFRLAAYDSSLKTFQKLDDLSQEPGFEKERVGLAAAISFYRAANLAALGRKEDARVEFENYLSVFPRADLDE